MAKVLCPHNPVVEPVRCAPRPTQSPGCLDNRWFISHVPLGMKLAGLLNKQRCRSGKLWLLSALAILAVLLLLWLYRPSTSRTTNDWVIAATPVFGVRTNAGELQPV